MTDSRPETASLGELVTAVVHRLRSRAGRHVLTLHRHVVIPLVPIDRVGMEGVVTTLIENAMERTPSGSPIDIWVRACSDCVLCEIADRSSGVPNDCHRSGRGSGFEVARSIVEAHGGQLTTATRWGGGAVFRVALPIPVEAPAGSHRAGAAGAHTPTTDGRWVHDGPGSGFDGELSPASLRQPFTVSELLVPIPPIH